MLVPVSGAFASVALSVSLFVMALAVAQFGDFAGPVLTGSDRSMQQYESFRLHVERDGHHELVVLGNSIARHSVNIRQLQHDLEPVLGRKLAAYNFAAGGTPPDALDVLVELIHGIDDPETWLIVLSPTMAAGRSEGAEQRRGLMHASPYGLAVRDPILWRGVLQRWLLDHVALARMRYGLRAEALGEPTSERWTGRYTTEFGYQKNKKLSSSAEAWERVRQRMHGWRFPAGGNRRILEQLVRRIQAHGGEVWLIEGAFHPRRLAALPDPAANLAMARAAIVAVAEVTGSHALLLPDHLRFSESDFADVSHLDAESAARYTAWLSASLARELRVAR